MLKPLSCHSHRAEAHRARMRITTNVKYHTGGVINLTIIPMIYKDTIHYLLAEVIKEEVNTPD
jgi:hypothetical protein